MIDLRRGADRRQVALAVPETLERRVSARRATDAIKMTCPFCGGCESAVVRTGGALDADEVSRWRRCTDCQYRFPTSETVDLSKLRRELVTRARRGDARAAEQLEKLRALTEPGRTSGFAFGVPGSQN